MKKWIALLLAAMMALALVACGETPNNENKDGSETKTEEFARGEWKDGVYTNASLGLAVTPPEGWVVASDEELAEIMGVALENTETTAQISEEFLKAQNCYDMMVQDPVTGANILLMAENLALSVGGTSYDEKAYSAVVINGLPEEYGYTFTDGETVTIGGREYYMIQATALDGALGQDYLFTRIGKHMVSVIVSYSPLDVDNDTMLAMLGDA